MGGELREEPAGVAKIGTFEKVGVETGEMKGLALEQLNLQEDFTQASGSLDCKIWEASGCRGDLCFPRGNACVEDKQADIQTSLETAPRRASEDREQVRIEENEGITRLMMALEPTGTSQAHILPRPEKDVPRKKEGTHCSWPTHTFSLCADHSDRDQSRYLHWA